MGSSSSNFSVSAGQAVALVDERYLAWVAGRRAGGAPLNIERSSLYPVFSGLARQMADSPLMRVCLFTETTGTELFDDTVVRTVPKYAADGGWGMVRSLGLELTQLASRGHCSVALIASDDERLIPYIDEAQWRGMKVVLVSDEAALDFQKLVADDPSWARLMGQVDRRVALPESAWTALTTAGVTYFAPRSPETHREDDYPLAGAPGVPEGDWRNQVEQVIKEWWAEETPDARLDLYEEMQNSQGVPPETDRHLLLRVRRELSRTLSFQEKKVMRELIRATVLAQPPEVDEPATH